MADDYSDGEFNGFSDQDQNQFEYEIENEHDYQSDLDDEDASETAMDSDNEPKDHTGFFDDEASDADSDTESDDAFPTFPTGRSVTPPTLHKFMQLPIELREMIWKQYCPALSAKPRVYNLTLCGPDLFKPNPHVEDQIAPLRIVRSVHRESRRLGREFAPNLVTLPHGMGVLPCSWEKDLFVIEHISPSFSGVSCHDLEALLHVVPFVQNLGFSGGILPDVDRTSAGLLSRFPDLKNLFLGPHPGVDKVPSRTLTWCVSGNTHEYHVLHREGCGLYDEDVDILTIWPDPDKFCESEERKFGARGIDRVKFDENGNELGKDGEIIGPAQEPVPFVATWRCELEAWRNALDPLHKDPWLSSGEDPDEDDGGNNRPEQTVDSGPPRDEDDVSQSRQLVPKRIRVFPFMTFMFPNAMRRLYELRSWKQSWDEWESSDCESDGEEDISDLDSDDSLNDFLAPDDTNELEDEDDSDDMGFPDNHEVIDLVDSSEEETSPISPISAAMLRSRSHVTTIDSDSEDDSEDSALMTASSGRRALSFDSNPDGDNEEENLQYSHSNTRRARATLDFDSNVSDEDVIDPRLPSRSTARRHRRHLAPLSDLEDDDDDEEAVQAPPSKRRRVRPVVESDSDDEERNRAIGDPCDPESDSNEKDTEASVTAEGGKSSSSSSDDEPAPPPKMSLAKRLRLEAAAARAAETDLEQESEGDGEEDGRASDDSEEVDEDEEARHVGYIRDDSDEEYWIGN